MSGDAWKYDDDDDDDDDDDFNLHKREWLWGDDPKILAQIWPLKEFDGFVLKKARVRPQKGEGIVFQLLVVSGSGRYDSKIPIGFIVYLITSAEQIVLQTIFTN